MQKTIVYLIRHSEQLKIKGIKNIKEDDQINNEKIILSVEGENKARELSKKEELNNIITLNDEDGKEVQFEFLDLIEYNEEEYVILLPIEETDDEEAGEVVILKVEHTESEDEESYIGVEDEDELNAVFAIFKDKFKDEFNFIDED